MADEKNLPDLVAKIRTEYDGKGVDDAKKDVREFKGDLASVGEDNGIKTADEKYEAFRQRLAATRDKTTDVKTGLGEVAGAGEAAGASAVGAFAGVATGAAVATTAIAVGKMALDAFNRAGEEGKLSGEQLEQYRELRGATDDLNDSLQDLEVAGGAALAPIVEQVATLADGLAELGNAKPFGSDETLATTAFNTISPLAGVGDALAELVGIGHDAAETEEEIASRTKIANDAFAEQERQAEATAKAMDAFAKAQLSEADAAFDLERRQDKLAEAGQKVSEAEAKVNLIRSGGRTEEAIAAADKLADAQERLADAHRKVADATDDLADKEENLREAQFRQGEQSEEAVKAQRDVDRARRGVEGARADVTDATGDVTVAQRRFDDATGTKALETAESELAAARAGYVDAARGVAKATADLAEATAEANQQAFDGDDKIRIYREALNKLSGDIGGPVGKSLGDLATGLHTANEQLDNVITKLPTVAPLFGMDFATGGAVTPQTAGGTLAVSGGGTFAPQQATAARAPVAAGPGAASIDPLAIPAVPTVAYQQTNNITVATPGVAHTVDDELMWLRANGPA